MKIYDLMFYASYKLSERSRNFDDTPVLGGCIGTIPPIGANFLSILFLLKGLGFDTVLKYSTEGKYTPFNIIGAIILLSSVYFYYKYKGRYKKILIKYEKTNIRYVFYWLIYVLYFVVSGVIMFICAFFMNRVWIFSDIPLF